MYRDYLTQQDYAQGTINTYFSLYHKFNDWCLGKGYDPISIDYKTFLEYVHYLKTPKKGKILSQKSVKHAVGALKVYFNYLVEVDKRSSNPIANLNIRGVKRSLRHDMLSMEELEELYFAFPTKGKGHHLSCKAVPIRNKVVTGLLIYQGLSITSLKQIKTNHLNIDKEEIYIPSTRKTNGRTLPLQSQQMLPLIQYLENYRLILQEKTENYSEQLILHTKGRFAFSFCLFETLRQINYTVKNAQQIKASVVSNWLKNYNIREVQYMAGHRYISSTERYLQDDLKGLQEMIEKLHPIV